MKKFLLSFFVTFASAVYVFAQYKQNGNTSAEHVAPSSAESVPPLVPPSAFIKTPSVSLPAGSRQQPPAAEPPLSPTPTPTPTPTPVSRGQYADGSYVGSVADAYYGYVQVKATVQGGKITAVDFLRYPNDRRTSEYINSQAMPYLESEALQAQSAQVDTVSGATDTSMAFRESLASALAKARP